MPRKRISCSPEFKLQIIRLIESSIAPVKIDKYFRFEKLVDL